MHYRYRIFSAQHGPIGLEISNTHIIFGHYQVVGTVGPAACLVAATSPLAGGDEHIGSVLVTLGLGLSALTLGGVSVSHLDIAPR